MAKKKNWPTDAATVEWEGDSREVLADFPAGVRGKLGMDIMRLQLGEPPLDSRPMQAIGKRIYELRQRDSRGWYRIIYLQRVSDRLFMLHSLVKKSARTPAKDLELARTRLKAVLKRIEEEKNNG